MSTAYPCGCGKGFTSLAALHQHRAALGCETAKQRKNRKSSTRLKRIRNRAARIAARTPPKPLLDEHGFDIEGIYHEQGQRGTMPTD